MGHRNCIAAQIKTDLKPQGVFCIIYVAFIYLKPLSLQVLGNYETLALLKIERSINNENNDWVEPKGESCL